MSGLCYGNTTMSQVGSASPDSDKLSHRPSICRSLLVGTKVSLGPRIPSGGNHVGYTRTKQWCSIVRDDVYVLERCKELIFVNSIMAMLFRM